MIERIVVLLYLAACIGIGIYASRKVLTSGDEYWVAGRRIGPWVNAMAIMAALASGGSIIGVMGLAYDRGIPATLALYAGAVVGFPLASILVARPLRRFGRYTIGDFLSFRYPHRVVRIGVPLLVVVSFTVYIVAQMKAAGITANALLGIPYDVALTASTIVFVGYVSIGGMLAITWTDVVQGVLMVAVVLTTAGLLVARDGDPLAVMATVPAAQSLGAVSDHPVLTDMGSFVIWAAAVPVIPHIVMRVYTAKDAHGARLSLNLAMVIYSAVILAAVLAIVPFGKALFPDLADADRVFLAVVQARFPPLLRGVAVAAVLAAVMSTTDALLLACSSAVAHDLLGAFGVKASPKAQGRINIVVVWAVGLIAMALAWSPPKLITVLYSSAIGVLAAGLFVPVIAGLWWRKANLAGGLASLVAGVAVYLVVQFTPGTPPLSAILFALPASALAMWLGGRFGAADPQELTDAIDALVVEPESAEPDSAAG